MMEFARRLAPRSGSDPARAVAVLPSRFADQPVRTVANEVEQHGDALDGAARLQSTSPDHATDARDRFEAAMDAPADVASAEPRIDLGLAQAAGARDRPTVPRADPTAPSPARSPLRGNAMARDGEAVLSAALGTAANLAMRPERELAPAGRAESDEPPIRAPLSARAHVAASAPARPIAESTIATQAATRAAAQPIVHVTIDRIDVRAPSPATAASAAATRPRPAPAGVSLGDYLRQSANPSRGRA